MRVTVIAPHDEGLPRREQIDGVDIVRVRYTPARYEQLAYRGGLLRAVRDVRRLPFVPGLVASLANGTRKVSQESRPDVIHAHWWLPSGLAALAARPRTLVLTLHGSDVGLLAKPGVAPLARAVSSHARFVAAVSEALLEEAAGRSASTRPAAASCRCRSSWTRPRGLTRSLRGRRGGPSLSAERHPRRGSTC